MRIRGKLIFFLTATVVVFFLAVSMGYSQRAKVLALQQLEKRALSEAKLLATALSDPLSSENSKQINSILEYSKQTSAVQNTRIVNHDGLEIAALHITPQKTYRFKTLHQQSQLQEDALIVQMPIYANQQKHKNAEIIGAIQMAWSLDELVDTQRQVMWDLLLIGFISLLVVLVMASMWAVRLFRPIQQMVAMIQSLGQNSVNSTLPVRGNDEIADLTQAFNQMNDHLRQTTVSRSYLDNILASMVDTLIVVEPNGDIQTCNQATCQLLNLPPEEIVGHKISKVIGVQQEAQALLHKVMRDQWLKEFDIAYRTASQAMIPMSLSGSTLKDDQGNITGVVFVGRDMRNTYELMEAVDAAAEAERQQTQKLSVTLSKLEKAHQELANSHRTLQKTQSQLVEASRQAGMAEIATSVLHNVGNVFNSVNVSTHLVRDLVFNSQVQKVKMTAELLEKHADDLENFLLHNPKGQRIREFLSQLALLLLDERDTILKEVELLASNIEHIKTIIVTQQQYAKPSGVEEITQLNEVLESALDICGLTISNKEGIKIIKNYHPFEEIMLDRHKVVQILVNLLTNARQALRDKSDGKQIILSSNQVEQQVSIEVSDNGCGIADANISKVFGLGFTTKRDGHGFGLHASANAAREMGGALRFHSAGSNQGTTVTLLLPLKYPNKNIPTR